MNQPQQPTWNLESQFTGLDDLEYIKEREALTDLLSNGACRGIEAVELILQRISHLRTYLSCLRGRDTSDRSVALQRQLVGDLEQCALECLDRELLERGGGELSNPWLSRRRARLPNSSVVRNLISSIYSNALNPNEQRYFRLAGSVRFRLPNSTDELRASELAKHFGSEDPIVRQAARDSFSAGWRSVSADAAELLSGIVGFRIKISEALGFVDPLDLSLGDNQVSTDEFHSFEQVWRSAARTAAERLDKTEAHDRAYLGSRHIRRNEKTSEISWPQAHSILLESFSELSPSFASFFELALDRGWIETRMGRQGVGGAFCTTSAKSGVPWVYAPFDGSLKAVLTLAHELGHAFHNWSMRGLTYWERSSPTVLRESLSTLGESAVERHLSSDSSYQADIAEVIAENAVTFLCDLQCRYLFERRAIEERRSRPLRPESLDSLMSWAQETVLGAVETSPSYWASRLHFFLASEPYYNWSYGFAYLFSRSLSDSAFQLDRRSRDSWLIDLASSTGLRSPKEIAEMSGGSVDTQLNSSLRWLETSLEDWRG